MLDRLKPDRDLGQPPADVQLQLATAFGQFDLPIASNKKRHTQYAFQPSYLVTDCRRRQVQERRGLLKGAQPRSRFKSIERGQLSHALRRDEDLLFT
ncbi:hypothetical protein D3C87_1514540 [compost metagenome]